MQEKYDFDKVTSRDKINYPYILGCELLKIQDVTTYGDPNAIANSIQGLVAGIPAELRDEQFFKEIKDAEYKVWKDNRPVWCGLRIGPKMYKDGESDQPEYPERGLQNQEEMIKIDYIKVKHACVNLLNRKNMLLKEQITEKFPTKDE